MLAVLQWKESADSENISADGNSIEVCLLPARFTLREKYVLGHRRQFINGFFKSSLCNFIQSLSLCAPAAIINTISTFDRRTNLGQGWRKEKSICARACWVIICRSINIKVPSRIFFAAFPLIAHLLTCTIDRIFSVSNQHFARNTN